MKEPTIKYISIFDTFDNKYLNKTPPTDEIAFCPEYAAFEEDGFLIIIPMHMIRKMKIEYK